MTLIRWSQCAAPRHAERGWRATFYTTGMEHSPVAATGTAGERTPWRATQRAAWEALRKVEAHEAADCRGRMYPATFRVRRQIPLAHADQTGRGATSRSC